MECDSIMNMMDAARRLKALERSRADIAEALVLVRAESGFSDASNKLEDSLEAMDELISFAVSLCQQAICVADKRTEFAEALEFHSAVVEAREAGARGKEQLRDSIANMSNEPQFDDSPESDSPGLQPGD